MRLTKRILKCGSVEIICHIGNSEWTSAWPAPPDSVDHAGHDYLENRYKCLTTEKRVKKFKQLYKGLMKEDL